MFGLPERASTIAGSVDFLFLVMTGLSLLIVVSITALIVFFSVKYHRGARVNRVRDIRADNKLEFTWSVVPLALALVVFGWSAALFSNMTRPPEDTLDIFITGRMWMWKAQHPDGQREINELHVPRGQPVRLIMISQDVIHSFFVPAFRVKQDVLPGRYTTLWFEATRTGEYHLFCAEYCGAKHAYMVGRVVVLEPFQYQEWLSQQPVTEAVPITGERLFTQLGCASCHLPDDTGRRPSLVGIIGQPREMETGEVVVADDNYLRQSILEPQAKVVAGYPPIMPSYQNRVTEDDLAQLILYIRSLTDEDIQ
jgi:cytochrome c oxidase subunit II